MYAEKQGMKVGGQAVMEGVMMRSPNSFAVAVRRYTGELTLREAPWRPLLGRIKIFRWPFLRGSIVLLESLVNGISALNFSAKLGLADMEKQARKEKQEKGESLPEEVEESSETGLSDWTLWLTLIFSLALGVGLFIALPHLVVWLGSQMIGRELTVDDVSFHLIVGLVKMTIFISYIALISMMKDIKRVFMYHAAEHQSIYTFEAEEPLEVEYAKKHSRLHPRCGTTFLIVVIALSIMVFSTVFPFLIWMFGEPTGIGWLDHALYILLKLPLLFPIAGLAYEFQRLTSRHLDRRWAKAMAWPGMFVQRLTTRPPDDDQLEVALASLRQALWREQVGTKQEEMTPVQETTYKDFASLVEALAVKG
jgi:uncharacterized protein YqhQ